MHVVLINDVSFARGGATTVFLSCIRAALDDSRNRVTAFVGDDGKNIRETFPSVRVISLNQTPLRDAVSVSDTWNKTWNGRAEAELSTLLTSCDVDTVVHVHGWSQILSPSIFFALRRFPINVVVTAHDFFLCCPNGGLVHFGTGDVCERMPLSVDCLTTNCDKRSYLQKLWRSQRAFVQRAAGEQFWSSVTVILAHRKMAEHLDPTRYAKMFELRSPSRPFVDHKVDAAANRDIVFLGRVVLEKGADVVARASDLVEAPMVMLGRGPLLESLRAKHPRLQSTGWVDDADLPRLLGRARVFLMPSRMPEPYGLVAVEAMMSGIPVIVSRSCLIAEEVEQSGAGVVVDAGDEQMLADAIDRLSRDDALVRKMSERAYEVGNAFAPTPNHWAELLRAAYREIVASPPSTADRASLMLSTGVHNLTARRRS